MGFLVNASLFSCWFFFLIFHFHHVYYNVSIHENLYIFNLLGIPWAFWICYSLDMRNAHSLFPELSLAPFSFFCLAPPSRGHWHPAVSGVSFTLCLFPFIHSLIPTDLFPHLLIISSINLYLLLIFFSNLYFTYSTFYLNYLYLTFSITSTFLWYILFSEVIDIISSFNALIMVYLMP